MTVQSSNLKKTLVVIGTSILFTVSTFLLLYLIGLVMYFFGLIEILELFDERALVVALFLLVLSWVSIIYLGGLLISKFIPQKFKFKFRIYNSILSIFFIVGVIIFVIYRGNRVVHASFVQGTKVLTPNGIQSIENLKAGDQVVSFDNQANKYVTSVVQEYRVRKTNEYYLINKLLAVTSEHLIAVRNIKGSSIWKLVRELGENEKIVGYKGDDTEIYKLEKINVSYPVYVYNPQVSSPHNYFVLLGDSPILAHNKH